MTLHELIVQSAHAAIELMNPETGSMPPGHNGPYHDPETPVRNTSHWLITFVAAHRISGDRAFSAAASRAAEYLSSEEARPGKKTFFHRLNPKKDRCNGLIGQAWTMEALLESYTTLGRDDLRQLAEDVFKLHPFDPAVGLWHPVEVDGTALEVDMTFNHQLWFASAVALLAHHGCSRASAELNAFLDCVDQRLRVARSGLIRHALTLPSSAGDRLRESLTRLRMPRARRQREYTRAVGYHAFNVYAFALIYRYRPNHLIWASSKFRRLLGFLESGEYMSAIQDNKYGFPYNPPGFEVALAFETFGTTDQRTRGEWWVTEQLRRCYDSQGYLMNRGTEDPSTHAARLYEATRLSDMGISV